MSACTEQEAKTRWCPMVRANSNTTAMHTDDDGNLKPTCIGKSCMLWLPMQIDGLKDVDIGRCGFSEKS